MHGPSTEAPPAGAPPRAAPPRRDRLVLFSRYPEPGRTKTRLIAALGADGAANLQRAMTEHIAARMQRLACAGIDVECRFAGDDAGRMADWLGAGLAYAAQGGGNLGERMAGAFAAAFADGCERAVIIGADCPRLTRGIVLQAFGALARCDLAVGPAEDGGYYLIGLRREAAEQALPGLFEGIAWGGAEVLRDTRAAAGRLGLRRHELKALPDVDRPDDLPVWEACRGAAEPDWSVVVPARNEAATIGDTAGRLLDGPGIEVVVADGASEDDTIARARDAGATVLATEGPRGLQCNAGAREAEGARLLFLHADTRLPADWHATADALLDEPGTAAGAFAFATDYRHRAMATIEAWANWRSRRLQFPYGDQGLFMGAATFAAAGGFPEWPIMDDFEMVRRLRRLGRIAIADAPAVTSGRRWRTMGPWRCMALNQLIVAAFHIGVPPVRLARWYRGRR